MPSIHEFSSPAKLRRAINSVNYHPGKLRRFLRKTYWAIFVYYLRANHICTVLTRNGLLQYESRDRTVGRILEVYRHFDFHDIELTTTFLRKAGILDSSPQGVVVDVGGFLGMSSTSFLHENIFSQALVFEPNPASFKLLKKNIKCNFFEDRVSCHNMALSDENGSLEFELSTSNYGDHRIRNHSSTGSNHFDEESRKIISVKSGRFDDFIQTETTINPEDIKLIWMDIQGHEGRFLRGAQNFLSAHPHVPTIMEFWPYAILRSGLSKKEFVASITSLYTHFFEQKASGFVQHDIDELDTFFDAQMNPNEWGTILLMNKTAGVDF